MFCHTLPAFTALSLSKSTATMTDVLNSEKLSAIANGVKKHMASFSKDFLTLYSTAVVNAAIDGELEEDADKPKEQEEPEQEQQDGSAEENNNEEQEDDEDARQLLQRPEGDEGGDEPLYTATMTKRGQVLTTRPSHHQVARAGATGLAGVMVVEKGKVDVR